MRMRGVICKESARFSRGQFTTFFYKDQLYPIILEKDNRWWLTNVKEKKRILVHGDLKVAIRTYFKPYQPFKKKTKYEKWKFKTRN
jgi:hypothetical protein